MDQFLVAIAAVVAFLGVMAVYVVYEDRKSRRRYEPTETGVEEHVWIRGGNYIPKAGNPQGPPPKPRK